MNPDLSPIVNHIFVDFENVQKIDPTVIGGKDVRLTLLAGPLTKWVGLDVYGASLKHPDSVELVQLTSSGRNALDFLLAYYVGRAAVDDPRGRFHIVSKDKGFDPLVEYLQSKGIQAFRHDSFAVLDLTRAPKAKSSAPKPSPPKTKPKTGAKAMVLRLEDLVSKALNHLRQLPVSKRPKKRTSLISYLHTHLGKKIAESKVEEIVKALENQVKINSDEKGTVRYDLE